jgi:hypothetical protein
MGEQFFDDLARGLDDGTISRRRALKLVGAAALGAALIPVMPKQAEALSRRARRRCRRKGGIPLERGNCHCAFTCDSNPSRFHCQSTTDCICLRTASGRGFCAAGTMFAADKCVNTTPCASGSVCVVIRGCSGSGAACTRDVQCGAFSCINGICQFTSCADPCPTM